MNIFDFSDYKDLIRAQIERNRLEKAYRSQLAEKMGCQKSFFSQVMNTHVHLTPDHAAALAAFWGLTDQESDYFIDLVSLARASTPALKKHLQANLKKAQNAQVDISQRLQWPQISKSEAELKYYSSWYWSAIHILVSSPKYQTVARIAERLHLKVEVVEPALRFLEQNHLIEKTAQGGWRVTETFLHLPNSSPLNEGHQSGWRQKAIHNLQSQDAEALHYTSVFTISAEDFRRVKETLLAAIKASHGIISNSPSEELVCLNFDLFRV